MLKILDEITVIHCFQGIELDKPTCQQESEREDLEEHIRL